MKSLLVHSTACIVVLCLLLSSVALAGSGSGGGSGGSGGTGGTIIQKDKVTVSTNSTATAVRIRSAITTNPLGGTGGTGIVTITNLNTNQVEYTGGMWFRVTYSINLDFDYARFNTSYRVDFVTYDWSGNVTDRSTTTIVTPAS